jgi:hypothetical protein
VTCKSERVFPGAPRQALQYRFGVEGMLILVAGGGFSGLFSSLSLISTLHDAASMRVSKNYLYLKARSRVVALASVEY